MARRGGRHGLAGAVGFYGSPATASEPGPVQLAAKMTAPVLALQAGDDANITADDNAAFEHALTEAGVEHELVTYEGAPHSFFDRRQAEHQAASDDAPGAASCASSKRTHRPDRVPQAATEAERLPASTRLSSSA